MKWNISCVAKKKHDCLVKYLIAIKNETIYKVSHGKFYTKVFK